MKQEHWNESLNHLDPALVDEYILQKSQASIENSPKRLWLRITAIAACMGILITVAVLSLLLQDHAPPPIEPPVADTTGASESNTSNETESSIAAGTIQGQETESSDNTPASPGNEAESNKKDPPLPPLFDEAKYSASYVAELMDQKTDGVATNAYTKVAFAADQAPNTQIPPEQELLSIYENITSAIPLDQDQFGQFVDSSLPILSESFSRRVSSYHIEENLNWDGSQELSVESDLPSASIHFTQRATYDSVRICSNWRSDERALYLDGQLISVDSRWDDAELLASLEPVKNRLFQAYAVSFPDTKVIRTYDTYGSNSLDRICVCFYNKQDLAFSCLSPLDVDHISIYFYDQGDPLLTYISIDYKHYRTEVENRYVELEQLPMISLTEAEALLCNGYVFGGHSCKLCMELQDKVDFENYDFVGFEYLSGIDYSTNTPTSFFPFYTFYKKLYTTEGGNDVYAKTYVCAVELSGYEEYFDSQVANHMYFNEPEVDS